FYNFPNTLGEEGLRIHGGNEHAAIDAISIVHDVTHTLTVPVGNLGHSRRDHAKNIGLDLEINVIRMQIVARVPRIGWQYPLANICEPGLVRMPHLANLLIPLAGDGNWVHIDAVVT